MRIQYRSEGKVSTRGRLLPKKYPKYEWNILLAKLHGHSGILKPELLKIGLLGSQTMVGLDQGQLAGRGTSQYKITNCVFPRNYVDSKS